MAEIIYVKLDDARQAMSSYNGRDLDGRILNIELASKIPIVEKLNNVSRIEKPSSAATLTVVKQPIVPIKAPQAVAPVVQQQTTNIKSTPTLPQRLNRTTSNIVNTTTSTSSTPLPPRQQQQQHQSSNGSSSKPSTATTKSTLSNHFANVNKQQQQQQQQSQQSASGGSGVTAGSNQLSNKVSVDLSVIHQALFNKSSTTASNSNPVTFTVKI